MEKILAVLQRIYGPDDAVAACRRIETLLARSDRQAQSLPTSRFSQSDVVLITYGDSLIDQGRVPLQVLADFARRYLTESFSAIHFLPFFPYSSDDGFSVIDFLALNPSLGHWDDVAAFSPDFDLMFDYVLNHISAQSEWFARYLDDDPQYDELAISVNPDADLSRVTRPRALPLLTKFTKASGKSVHLWTTFSEDQIDLNYQSIDVLSKMIEVLLFYVARGARLLRMDAVAYLWKQIGTPCIHLDQTHDMVRLLRNILDIAAPGSVIITETNVPHAENISYFGNGFDEAQMVYNFTLPPLLLYTFLAEDAQELSSWAKGLDTPSEATTFFNFTASHDGIGVRPVEGILSPHQIERLIEAVKKNGGQVSYKQNPDGTQSPYELNITYLDALRRSDRYDVQRFLASQAIQAVLPGVPGIYIHSLLGSRNWMEGVELTGRARSINREKLQSRSVIAELENTNSLRSRIFNPYCHILHTRRAQTAFHPNARFEILHLDHRVFGIKRWVRDQCIYALTNICKDPVMLSLSPHCQEGRLNDLLTNRQLSIDKIDLSPYQTIWLSD
jgi:sucrose phosphorylase